MGTRVVNFHHKIRQLHKDLNSFKNESYLEMLDCTSNNLLSQIDMINKLI